MKHATESGTVEIENIKDEIVISYSFKRDQIRVMENLTRFNMFSEKFPGACTVTNGSEITLKDGTKLYMPILAGKFIESISVYDVD